MDVNIRMGQLLTSISDIEIIDKKDRKRPERMSQNEASRQANIMIE